MLDLDGTLLQSDGQVAREDIMEVQRVHGQDVAVAIATGRDPDRFRPVLEALEFQPHLICSNGAHVVYAGRPLVDRWLEPELVSEILGGLARRGCKYRLFTTDGRVVAPAAMAGFTRPGTVLVDDIEAYLDAGPAIRKVTAVGRLEELLELSPWVQAQWGERVNHWITGSHTLEMGPLGCSKHTGLVLVAGKLGISLDDTLVVGDSYNDLELLEAVGMPVAMGNAVEAAKRVAVHVTGTNDQHGVATALRYFVPCL